MTEEDTSVNSKKDVQKKPQKSSSDSFPITCKVLKSDMTHLKQKIAFLSFAWRHMLP